MYYLTSESSDWVFIRFNVLLGYYTSAVVNYTAGKGWKGTSDLLDENLGVKLFD